MSIVGLLLVAQAAAPQAAAAAPLPDIELRARADIRSLELRSQGEARIDLRAEPGVTPPVRVTRSLPPGRTNYRNLRIELHAIARIAAPAPIAAIDTGTDTSSDTSTGDPE